MNEGLGLDLKKTARFRIRGLRVFLPNGAWDGPCRSDDCASPHDERQAKILLYLVPEDYGLLKLLGDGAATARIERRETGFVLTGTGIAARGQMDIGDITQDGGSRRFVDIGGFMPGHPFDQILEHARGGNVDRFEGATLTVGFRDPKHKVDLESEPGELDCRTYLLSDIVVSFHCGDRWDEYSGWRRGYPERDGALQTDELPERKVRQATAAPVRPSPSEIERLVYIAFALLGMILWRVW